mmetsp:Transcript_77196/g.140332  ORF Transcript_77196/g.140332 Transcript_77196/m.140332 type:complete len:166 (+) Transcript_77196:31-528(+)
MPISRRYTCGSRVSQSVHGKFSDGKLTLTNKFMPVAFDRRLYGPHPDEAVDTDEFTQRCSSERSSARVQSAAPPGTIGTGGCSGVASMGPRADLLNMGPTAGGMTVGGPALAVGGPTLADKEPGRLLSATCTPFLLPVDSRVVKGPVPDCEPKLTILDGVACNVV